MKVKERRELLLSILNKSAKPIKGDELANTLNVSRQVIVQDIALIRATGVDIIATPRPPRTFGSSSLFAYTLRPGLEIL